MANKKNPSPLVNTNIIINSKMFRKYNQSILKSVLTKESYRVDDAIDIVEKYLKKVVK